MNRKQVQNEFYERLSLLLSPYSFKLKKSQEAFVRIIPEGRQSIYVSLVDLEPNFEFSPVIAFRFDSVEKIAHLYSGSPEKYQDRSETAIVQLDYFTGGNIPTFTISSREEIGTSIAQFSQIFNRSILPVLDECTNIKSIYDRLVFQSNPSFNSAQPPYSILTSLAIAYLAGSEFPDGLAVTAINSASNLPSADRDKVANLVAYLKQNIVPMGQKT